MFLMYPALPGVTIVRRFLTTTENENENSNPLLIFSVFIYRSFTGRSNKNTVGWWNCVENEKK